MPYTTEAQRWRALATRDPNANGHFFYSVKSTQIYCRPTCPARLARRANISFQKTIAEAEALGFRACKRCRPNVENEDPQDKAVAKAMSFIEEAVRKGEAKNLKLHDLAKIVGLTPRYFHKIFKDKTATTPREYTNIVAAQHNSSSPCSGSDASPSKVENFDWDTFDITDLANYQFDASPALRDDFMAKAAEITAAGFGETPAHESPLQSWTMSSPNSDTDSMISNEQLLSASGWDSAFVDFEQYPSIKPIPMEQPFDFDVDLATLLQNDIASANLSLDMLPDFDLSAIPVASGPQS